MCNEIIETNTFTQSHYNYDYNAFQLSLPLDLGIKLNSDDEADSFLKALEGVNLYKCLKKSERCGRKEYDNVMLLKVVRLERNAAKTNDIKESSEELKN